MADTPRSIDYLPLNDIREAPHNPKTHDADVMNASVSAFGFMDPVIIDDRTGLLVSGHGRLDHLRASHARGDAPAEGIMVADDGRWLVPVVRGWAASTIAMQRLR